jgi:hypothetical protein
MREQVVRQQYRLRRLQVGLTGHDRGRMRCRLRRQRIDHRERTVGDSPGSIA